jgi:prepilin-type N-terminal cleavage/methylation domain-containing protein
MRGLMTQRRGLAPSAITFMPRERVAARCLSPLVERRRRRASFTLVELLVVIAIIGLLAAMLVGGLMAARVYVRKASIRMEIEKLSQSLNDYRLKYGEFPPDFTDQTVVVQHLAKAFPRYAPTWNQFVTDVKNCCGLDPSNLTPAGALVFWLGGPPTAAGQKQFKGFSANPFLPFDPSQGQGPMFEFDVARLVGAPDASGNPTTNGWMAYSPPAGMNIPYVYFRASNGTYGQTCKVKNASGTIETLNAYTNPNITSTPPTYYNPTSFQLFTAGLDGVYGVQGSNDADDNIANFTFTDMGAQQP